MTLFSKLKSRHLLVLAALSLFLASCDTAAIGNFVWLDLNGDGEQNIDEPGMGGVTVHLFVDDSVEVQSIQTNESGFYYFRNLPIDSYSIVVDPPDGYQFTLQNQGNDTDDSDVDPATGATDFVKIGAKTLIEVIASLFEEPLDKTVDAGLIPIKEEAQPAILLVQSHVEGIAWQDSNANGLREDGEPGLAGIPVALFDANGQVDDATTNGSGEYAFNLVTIDEEYYVQFSLGGQAGFTQRDAGDDALDSDADPSTGETEAFTLTAAGAAYDAGFIPPAPLTLGPDEFPTGYNPLTGQPLCDPEAANWGVVGLSISQFPPQATRPPKGLSWAAWVSEWWIGDGDTRLYAQFYGCYPEVDQPADTLPPGQLPEPGEGEYLIGNFVWYDANGNSLQDEGEPGIPDIPVDLILKGQVVASTTTDSTGQYYFLVQPEFGYRYQVQFHIPEFMQSTYAFVQKHLGDDTIDNDADSDGMTDTFLLPESGNILTTIDAGLRQGVVIEGIRSGRLVYETMRKFFEGCTVIAGADPEVLAQIQVCAQARSSDTSDIGAAGIDVTQIKEIAQQNVSIYGPPNLTGNLFSEEVPAGCQPANSLLMFYNINNQTYWSYNPATGAYTRHQNTYLAPDVQELSTDGISGQPIEFANVIVFFAQHDVLNSAGTIISVPMESTKGVARLFRDGMVCDLYWSTLNGDYEKETGRLRPIRFEDADGNPFPLKPGQLFIHMVATSYTDFFEPVAGSGDWKATWHTPPAP